MKANRVLIEQELRQPGDFFILENEYGRWMYFICPCATQECRRHTSILLYKEGQEKPNMIIKGSSWLWDGDMDKPTLIPSIQRNSLCRWHGYLTAGFFKGVLEVGR